MPYNKATRACTVIKQFFASIRPKVSGNKNKPKHQSGRNRNYENTQEPINGFSDCFSRLNENISSFIQQHHAHYEKSKTESGKNYFWTKLAAVGGSLAAAFTFFAFAAASFQAWVARDTKKQQLRAYVAVDQITRPVFAAGLKLFTSV